MIRRQSIKRRFRRVVAVSLVMVVAVSMAAGYVFGMSAWQASQHTHFAFVDLLVPRLVDVVIVGWLVWVGSSIGSFLNVVAWRMPRGEGVGGRSHCPRCQTKLLAQDNFPVLGWISLGGRCRTCRLPISPRYPIVEAAVGISLTVLGIAELYRLNLPHDPVGWHFGPVRSPTLDRTAILTLVYHTVAVAFCWAFALIRLDRHALPGRLLTIGAALLIVPMLVMPSLGIVTWRLAQPAANMIEPQGFLQAVARLLTALAAAGFAGRSLSRVLFPQADLKLSPLGQDTRRLVDLIAIIALPSIVVGWQALPMVLFIMAVLVVACRRFFPQADALGCIALAMPWALVLQLILWRASLTWVWWPSEGSDPWVILLWAFVVLMLPVWLKERPVEPDEARLAQVTLPKHSIGDE